MSISVFGAGAFGTALAISLSNSGSPVTLWARNADTSRDIDNHRENRARLPGHQLPASLKITSDCSSALSDIVLLSVPMQKLRDLLTTYPQLNGRTLVACCKGIELTTSLGPVALINELAPDSTAAILTGPSFATDIAKGLPTALTLACADDEICKTLQTHLITPNLRIYRTSDTIGAEIGGALKNVIAIACGAAIGAGLGDSARAAVMTRGYAEMTRMAHALGARTETLSGLSGFGDLALTCTSESSRNYRFGLSIGARGDFDTSTTVEGAPTARATLLRAQNLDIEMPITEAVVALIDQKLDVLEAMELLLSRPPREE